MPARKSPTKKAAAATGGPVLKIRVTLLYTEPPVWREFVVNSEMPLDSFCEMLLYVMGWEGGHMHEIMKGRVRYRPASPFGMDDDFDDDVRDAGKHTVADVLDKKGAKCHWTYDFGDSWEHEIKVLKTGVEWSGRVPACTDGARACPPEDCGGNPGYENLCAAMADKKHPEHANLIEWLGAKFDPEAFSLKQVNDRLA